jgi:hypothetical protein
MYPETTREKTKLMGSYDFHKAEVRLNYLTSFVNFPAVNCVEYPFITI